MSNDTLRFSCGACGSAEFRYPNVPPLPDDVIECNGCGQRIGRYQDVQAHAVERGRALIDNLVEKAFGKKPTWRKQ